MSKQDATFHAFEEWWAITGADMLDKAQAKGAENGIEVDAFAAGAEWMRGECERTANSAQVVTTSADRDCEWNNACERIVEIINALGGAQ